jgi:ataxin-3
VHLGYSVFAVAPIDPTASPPQTLPHSEADEVAASLPEPSSTASAARLNMSHGPSRSSAAMSHNPVLEGFEDEDMELQAALQASLMAGDAVDFVLPPSLPPPIPSLTRPRPIQSPNLLSGPSTVTPETDTDPVAASMARNRAIIERMRRQQEMALRESREEEVARFQWRAFPTGYSGARGSGSGQAEAGEDNEFNPAIAEQDNIESHDTDDEDDDDPDYEPPGFSSEPPTVLQHSPDHRVYDDDDAELQAALKASLEGVPEGFAVPDFRSTTVPSHPATADLDRLPQTEDVPEADASLASASSVEEEREEELSVDEMRRRRLARFGG